MSRDQAQAIKSTKIWGWGLCLFFLPLNLLAYIPEESTDKTILVEEPASRPNLTPVAEEQQREAMKHFLRGKELQAMQNYAEAIREHQRALELDPNLTSAQQALKWAQRDFKRKNVEKSTSIYNLQALVSQAKKYYQEGLAHEQQHNLLEAAAAYKSALRLIPSYPEAQEALKRIQTNAQRTLAPSSGTIFMGKDRSEVPVPSAINPPPPTQEISPEDEVISQIKVHSLSRGKSNSTSQAITGAIQKHFLIGSQALDQADYPTAIMEFELILEFMPNHTKALYKLNLAKKRLAQEIKSAQQKAEEAKRQGDTIGEISAIRDMVNMDPNNQEARQAWEQARKENTNVIDQLYRRGVNAYAQGKYNEALQAWELVLDLNPKHAKAQASIQKVREKMELIK